MTIQSLDALFKPRSIAVVGASRKRGTIGAEVFHNLLRHGFNGAVYPVNPGAEVVQSVRAYPTVQAIPGDVEMAVIVVPKKLVKSAVEDCIKKGVRGLVVITAGFAEVDKTGRALQDEILALCRKHSVRMVGPNCLGLINSDPEIALNATFAPTWPPFGNVAFSSQSGALGLAILDHAKALGIGVHQFVSVGNKADVSGNDLLEYWENDPQTKVILLYLESFGNPKRFLQIASRVSHKKPIVMVKSGRTGAGARAASSHTAALATSDVAVDALLTQAGVIRTDTIEELFDMAMLLANQPIPKGPRVAILTNAGGPGIMAADACESRGLLLPELSESTLRQLKELLPPEASIRNPIDMIASATPAMFEASLRAILNDPNVDSALVLFVPPIVTEAKAVAEAILKGAANTAKPVLTCFMGTHGVPPALSSLRQGHFPSYAFPEAAARALAKATRYHDWLQRPHSDPPKFNVDTQKAQSLIQKCAGTDTWLPASSVFEILRCYGIAAVRTETAHSAEEAVNAAKRLGFPVVMKVASTAIIHKSDVGGVLLNLKDAEAVQNAYAQINDKLRQQGIADSHVILQPFEKGGVEVFAGMTVDPNFGPLLAFGLGGTQMEIWQDLVFRLAPLTKESAQQMIHGIRGVKLLAGFRGQPPVDEAALVDLLLRLSQLVQELPNIVELDCNPVLVRPTGQGATVLDARMKIKKV